MKISLRMLLISLPVVALSVMLIGIASIYMTNAHASGPQVHPNAVPQHIISSDVNLSKCDNGPQSNCSVLTQLMEGDLVNVHCQTASGSSWWAYVDAPDYGDTGWVSNTALSGGPGAIRGVPACTTQH